MRSSASATAVGCHAPAREHLVEDAAIGGMVVDHEHAEALERSRRTSPIAAAGWCGVSKSAVK